MRIRATSRAVAFLASGVWKPGGLWWDSDVLGVAGITPGERLCREHHPNSGLAQTWSWQCHLQILLND